MISENMPIDLLSSFNADNGESTHPKPSQLPHMNQVKIFHLTVCDL
jgi:hypothetical protein